jgi:hypothetical protein
MGTVIELDYRPRLPPVDDFRGFLAQMLNMGYEVEIKKAAA